MTLLSPDPKQDLQSEDSRYGHMAWISGGTFRMGSDRHYPEEAPVHRVTVDGFWPISLYNAEGYYQKNPYGAYSLNNITSKKNADGSVTIQFGGCDGKIPNCLPIMNGWSHTARLYRPRPEILSGKWKFPEPQPAG
jgi:hypothetical protein